MAKKVRIVDIGSNSIKILISSRSGKKQLVTECEDIEEVRIGAGLANAQTYSLSDESQQRAVAAVSRLLQKTEHFEPTLTRIVATSAVRDAANRQEFAMRIEAACKCPLTILSGSDEARYIALGVASDVHLPSPVTIVDLGGGSLECIDVVNGASRSACSFQLGAVRLTEQFHPNHHAPLAESQISAIYHCTQSHLAAQLTELRTQRTVCVGCGGAFAVIRAILAQREGLSYSQRSANISLTEIEQLQQEVAAASYNRRLQVPGLPPTRADIFPTALTIVLAVANYFGTHTFYHSLRNLRYGLAEEYLEFE